MSQNVLERLLRRVLRQSGCTQGQKTHGKSGLTTLSIRIVHWGRIRETFLQSAHAKSCVLAQFNQSQGKFIVNLDLL